MASNQEALVTVFGSTEQPLEDLMSRLVPHFPDSVLVGASTAGEFTERGDAKRSAVLFGLAGDYKVYAGDVIIKVKLRRAKADRMPLTITVQFYPTDGKTCGAVEKQTTTWP